MAKKHIDLTIENRPDEAGVPNLATNTNANGSPDSGVGSCADITPTNAKLLKLAEKYPPPAEWQQADDVDSFFDAE